MVTYNKCIIEPVYFVSNNIIPTVDSPGGVEALIQLSIALQAAFPNRQAVYLDE